MAPVWLFDLDNTLHNASPHIFPHINRSMTAYLMLHLELDEPTRQPTPHGLLAALRRHPHRTDAPPRPPIHASSYTTPTSLPTCRAWWCSTAPCATCCAACPARRSSSPTAPAATPKRFWRSWTSAATLPTCMRSNRCATTPSPSSAAFLHLIKDHRLDPARCILVEDSAENLRTAKRLGMRTVWISRSLRQPDYVDLQLSSVLGLTRHTMRIGASG